jgi:hypothetical protein
LTHGIEKKLWLMQYQYEDESGNFQGDNPGAIARNWRRLEEISVGDRLAAYLKRNTFFATGTVTRTRHASNSADHTGTIEGYLNRKKSHEHKTGFVFYTPVFYEDFSDKWRAPGEPLSRWPQRIDVDEWRNFVPEGVELKGLNKIPLSELRVALFEISKKLFDQITDRLVAETVDDSVIEAHEHQQAKGQGFQLDSKLRIAIENYAMNAAQEYFKSRGYEWEDVSKTSPYDLRCTRRREVLYVEVKGTQEDGSEVFLTKNEVHFARHHEAQMVLFVLHSIDASKFVSGRILAGGTQILIRPWIVDDGILTPMSFKYRHSGNHGNGSR